MLIPRHVIRAAAVPWVDCRARSELNQDFLTLLSKLMKSKVTTSKEALVSTKGHEEHASHQLSIPT